MKAKIIVYFILLIVAAFAAQFLSIYNELHSLLLHGYKTELSIDDMKHLLDENMCNFKSSITKMLALLGVIAVCISFKKGCY